MCMSVYFLLIPKMAKHVDASNAYVWENMCVLRDYFAKHLPKARVCGGEGAYILWIDWSAYFSSGDELNEFLS